MKSKIRENALNLKLNFRYVLLKIRHKCFFHYDIDQSKTVRQ